MLSLTHVQVKFSDLSMEFGNMFSQLAIELDEVNRQSLNGDPFGDNGWMTLVTGGLFAGAVDMGESSIADSSLKQALPRYIAYIEDKMLQMMMRELLGHQGYRAPYADAADGVRVTTVVPVQGPA